MKKLLILLFILINCGDTFGPNYYIPVPDCFIGKTNLLNIIYYPNFYPTVQRSDVVIDIDKIWLEKGFVDDLSFYNIHWKIDTSGHYSETTYLIWSDDIYHKTFLITFADGSTEIQYHEIDMYGFYVPDFPECCQFMAIVRHQVTVFETGEIFVITSCYTLFKLPEGE